MNRPIPMTILTGFLGAGKTTLLNHILQGNHGLRVAALVNDFGAINIDAKLVVGVEDIDGEQQLVELANGCICCTIRDDLLNTVLQVVQRPYPPEYILIEASGVSEPGAILRTFWHPQLRDTIQVDGVITIIDAEQVMAQNDRARMLILDQIGTADILILNKVDLVSAEKLAEVKAWIGRRVPKTRILEAVQAQAPLNLLLDIGHYRLEPPADTRHHEHDEHCDHDHAEPDHGLQFSTWSYETQRPFSRLALREAIKQLPDTIFRAKGVLAVADLPDHRVILQVVGRRMQMSVGAAWGDERPQSQLVVIGTPDGVNADELTDRFDACLVDNLSWLDQLKLSLKSRLS